MGYPSQYPPQFGPGGGMPPQPVSGTVHTFAGIVGVFFALSILVYLVEMVQHLGSAPVKIVLVFLLYAVSMLVAGAGAVMVVAKVRVGAYLVVGGVALFYLAWLISVFSSGAPGLALESTFSQAGWNAGIAPSVLLGIPAAVLALIPPTQNYIKQHHMLKSGQWRPPQAYGQPPQPYGQPAAGPPQPYGQPPQPYGQPPQPYGQPQYPGAPPQYPGAPPQGQQPPYPGQPQQW